MDGKKLKAGTDYAIDAESYVVTDPFGMVRTPASAGSAALAEAQPGDTITVTLLGKGKNYEGSKKTPVYLEPGRDFIVESYEKNTKTGTAKVTLKGIGNWGGTKTLSFRIKPKK